MLGARFAQLHPHVDEPGAEAQPGAIDDVAAVAEPRVAKIAADSGDAVAIDQQIAGRVEPAFRIDEPGIAKQATRGTH